MMKRYIKKISNYTIVGGLGAFLIVGLSGCEDKSPTKEANQASATPLGEAQKKGAFVILEETEKNKYKVQEEFPAQETKVILKKLDGTEKILTKEELDALVKEEAAKIDNNTSNLTKPPAEQVTNNGLSLGETILASAAGAVIGSWIGSKLFGNQNYQNNRQATYKNPSTFSRSISSFNKPSSTSSAISTTTKKSGFFSSSKPASSSSSTFGG